MERAALLVLARAAGLLAAALALVLAAPAHAATGAEAYAQARAAFQQAYALASGEIGPATAATAAPAAAAPAAAAESPPEDPPLLRDYPLYPYLQAARIRQALSAETGALGAVDAQAREFLSVYAEQPVATELRRAWLESLARRSQWEAFLEAYREAQAGPGTRCRALAARIALGRTEDIAPQIQALWLTAHALPECDPAFTWLEQQGALTPALIEQRARLALQSGNAALARELAARLPAEQAEPLRVWAGLIEHPQAGIDKLLASRGSVVEPAALEAGWSRLVRRDSTAAKQRYAKLMRARHLKGSQAAPYALALAVALAWDHDREAQRYFARVPPTQLDGPSLEWRARAAIWARDWRQLLRSIGAMPTELRHTPRWEYWTARAAEHLHTAPPARVLYERVLSADDYYSAMAAARLDRAVQPHPQALEVDPAMMASVERLPAMERARELFLCGLRPEAAAEWQFGYAALSPAERLQSVPLAAGWGWFDQAVMVASAQRVFNDYVLLYPQPFDSEVDAAAQLSRLEPETLYGVVRQESLYRADVISPAGARGLMQLMPETARRTAREWKLPPPTAADLLEPAPNLSLGAALLRTLIDRFDGQVPLALAAYNAGYSAVQRWLPAAALDSDVWIENIPYGETREYVQRVLWHRLLFAWLRRKEQPQRTEAWLDPIRPVPESERAGRMAVRR